MSLTPMDILFIGIAVYLVFRFLSNMGRKNTKNTPHTPHTFDKQQRTDIEKQQRRHASTVYENASAAWGHFASTSEKTENQPKSPDAPGTFDETEFMYGARSIFFRIQESWEARDMEDLQQFMTPALFAHFLDRANKETRGITTQIQDLQAHFADHSTTQDQEEVQVQYTALMQQTGEDRVTQEGIKKIHTRWRFVRHPADPDSNWLLDEIIEEAATYALNKAEDPAPPVQ